MNIDHDQSAICDIYQWICLDKLYKPMESFFFQIFNSFSNYQPKNKKYSIYNKVRFMQASWNLEEAFVLISTCFSYMILTVIIHSYRRKL